MSVSAIYRCSVDKSMVFHYWVLLDVLPCRFYHIKYDSEVLFDILFFKTDFRTHSCKKSNAGFYLNVFSFYLLLGRQPVEQAYHYNVFYSGSESSTAGLLATLDQSMLFRDLFNWQAMLLATCSYCCVRCDESSKCL